MSVRDVSPKSHKKSKKSKSAGARANPEDVDEARVKPKKIKHREATSDVLSINPHTDQAPTIQDSSTSDPSYPLNSSGPGNVTSDNAQLADSATDGSKDVGSRKEKKKTKKKKHLDEGEQEGVAKSDDTKVPTMEEAVSEKTQQKKRKRIAEKQSEDTLSVTKPRKKKKDHGPTDILFPDPSADESLPDQSRKGMPPDSRVYLLIMRRFAALSYAYARFQDQPSWKFNKAKQIWLVKRLWSEEMVSLPCTFVG